MKIDIKFQHSTCAIYAVLVMPTLLMLAIGDVGEEVLSLVRQTTSGKIQGYVHTLKDGQKVERYLGVPYATPPVGDRRFELPQAAQNWTGVRKTISVSAACMQSSLDHMYIKEHAPDYKGNMSEDCLYLNIYVPRRQSSTLLPVLAHVHGGSNEAGMGAMLHGDVLASRGQLVVLTFNYRLGAFGFLHVPHLGIPGNLGLHDQLLVFKWIQANIGQFGGDPTKVTIQGHSAGSVDVGIHVLSPASTGLFRYAILQSGAPTSYWALLPDPAVGDMLKGPPHHVHDLGCADWDDKKEALACMKDINATRLSTKYYNHGGGIYRFSPTVDGFFLAEHPLQLLGGLAREQTGTVNSEALLMGVVRDEGAVTANAMRQDDLKQDIEDTSFRSRSAHMPDLFEDQHFKEFPESILNYYKKVKKHKEMVYFVYKPWSDPENVTANYMRLSDLVGDMTFTAPTVQTADYLIRANRTHVYLYSFEHRSELSLYPQWMGVPHGDDLFYLFGCPIEGHPARNYTDLDRSVSLALMDMWAQFIKHGKPSYGNFSSETYSDDQKYILIDSKQTDVIIRQERRLRARHMVFWNSFMTLVTNVEPETPDRTERQTFITWVLAALLCVVSVVSLAAILCLCRKMMSQRRHVRQACKT